MFRIRRVFDDSVQLNREAVLQVQTILRTQFHLLSEEEIRELPQKLRDPVKARFRPILYVAEGSRQAVQAFALLLHAPDLKFCYLDFLSAAAGKTGRGLGGILYEAVRAEARSLSVCGIFLECLPDTPELSPDPLARKQNTARLRFYERYGARPVAGTKYETPLKQGDTDPPFLVFDDLGSGVALRKARAREITRAILERKYGSICPPGYIDMVVQSFGDDPVRLREPRYVKAAKLRHVSAEVPRSKQIMLVVSDRHEIHHVHDRGYVESPVRIASILKSLEPSGLFARVERRGFRESWIGEVHDHSYISYFKRVCRAIPPTKPVYPYVFPIRNAMRRPRELAVRAGYYCIDTFTPLTMHAFLAARAAVDCALTGAEGLLEGQRIAYALVRPPGHHAERASFGGFCYFNSAAVAAHYLSRFGKVAILDIDYHHGNGQQDIFYRRSDVLTVSIHGHPNIAYPYFSGFRDERGYGPGLGYNVNYPLPETIDTARYTATLEEALRRVKGFAPEFLIVAFGLDTARNDPTGSWGLMSEDFERNGRMIGTLHLKTLVVQEGGYDNRVIGSNARRFFAGLWKGYFG